MNADEADPIIERFARWLRSARVETEALGLPESAEESAGEGFGLIDLVAEFTALKHEVKLHTKSARGVTDQMERAVAALAESVGALRLRMPEGDGSGKPLALALVELDEALERGASELARTRQRIGDELARDLEAAVRSARARSSWFGRWLFGLVDQALHEEVRAVARKHSELFDAVAQGYGVIHNRLRRTLAGERIAPIPCEGSRVDPALMTVLDVVDDPALPAGLVVAELRRGYTWNGQVLRFAEVRANRPAHRADAADEAPTSSLRSS